MSKIPLGRRTRIGIIAVIVVAILVLAGVSLVVSSKGTKSESGKLQVVASFYPLYFFSTEVGKDKIDASMLIPDNAEPHAWEPSPSDLRKVTQADVLVYNGQGFEPWMSSFLDSVENDHLVVVDTSNNISPIVSSEVREVYDEANGTLVSGPFDSVAATPSNEGAPVVKAETACYHIMLSNMTGGSGGFVAMSVLEGGDYRFFVTNATSFKITEQNGAEVTYEMDLGKLDSYPMFNSSKFFEMEAGETYYVSFDPSQATGTDLVMVRAADEGGKGGSEESHHHGLTDPHFWLDPLNAMVQVDNIAEAFKEADPVNAEYYQRNADNLKVRLSALDHEFRDGLAGRTKNVIVTTHEGFDYLANRYGFEAYAALGISADSQPSAQDLANLADKVTSLGLHYVFGEPIYSDATMRTIAEETKTQVLVLDGIHGRTGVHEGWNYFQIMEDNLKNLQKGLEVTP